MRPSLLQSASPWSGLSRPKTRSSRAPSGLSRGCVHDAQRGNPHNFVRGARDLDTGFVEVPDDTSRDRVFHLTDPVLTNHETNGQLQPVVGQAIEDPRRQVVEADEVPLLERMADRLAVTIERFRFFRDAGEQDCLGPRSISAIGKWAPSFPPR